MNVNNYSVNEHKTKKNDNGNLIQLYLSAIDNKDKEKIKILYNENNNNNIENDIILEIYNKKKLNSEKLEFILENCTAYLNISSSFLKKLIKDNNKKLLEILFEKHFKFFDNNFILDFLTYYKNKTPISNSKLYPLINNDKYKISTRLKYVEYDDDIDWYDSSYYLFDSCKSGNEIKVRFLLEHGANMMIKDYIGNMALMKACDSGNIRLVKYLIQLGADINNENISGETPIFDACFNGNLNFVKYLIELGADIKKENDSGETPIFKACTSGNLNLVKYLVEKGADINKENNNGWTPLFSASYN